MENLKNSISKGSPLVLCILSVFLASCNYSNSDQKTEEMMKKTKEMPTFVIEREVKNVGNSTPEELKVIARESNTALKELGPDIQWQHSYIVGNKTYCVYKARDKSLIVDHARKAGVPANSISQVSAIIDPNTAE